MITTITRNQLAASNAAWLGHLRAANHRANASHRARTLGPDHAATVQAEVFAEVHDRAARYVSENAAVMTGEFLAGYMQALDAAAENYSRDAANHAADGVPQLYIDRARAHADAYGSLRPYLRQLAERLA